jgi:hypothetical protein
LASVSRIHLKTVDLDPFSRVPFSAHLAPRGEAGALRRVRVRSAWRLFSSAMHKNSAAPATELAAIPALTVNIDARPIPLECGVEAAHRPCVLIF